MSRSKEPKSARSRRALLAKVGERVRALRDERGVPRRALAEASGVSERFLAELEAGSGNISVARLADVAAALKSTPASLLDGGGEATTRAAIDALLGARSEAELREVRAWLQQKFGG